MKYKIYQKVISIKYIYIMGHIYPIIKVYSPIQYLKLIDLFKY